jgi:hypothetical protein
MGLRSAQDIKKYSGIPFFFKKSAEIHVLRGRVEEIPT